MTRYEHKAEVVKTYWNSVMGGPPPCKQAVLLVMCVAEHESRLGDLKNFGFNWGACTIRGLTQADRDAIAAGTLKVGDIQNGGILYGDSSFQAGKYLTWFAAFPDADSGAGYFLKVLVKTRPTIAALLKNPEATPRQLAELMYAGHYFLGVHNPATPAGKEANIKDYAGALEKLYGPISAGLAGWGNELNPVIVEAVREEEVKSVGPALESEVAVQPEPVIPEVATPVEKPSLRPLLWPLVATVLSAIAYAVNSCMNN